MDTLKAVVRKVYVTLRTTEAYVNYHYPQVEPILPEEITFITSQELENMYPGQTPKEREYSIAPSQGSGFYHADR